MNSFTLPNVSLAQIDALESQLPSTGATLTHDASGHTVVTGKGVTAQVEYDALAMTLTVTILHKPLLYPMGVVVAEVQGIVTKALGMAA